MKNVFFKPWIGKDYQSGGIFGKKILIVGKAHICKECKEERCTVCGDVDKAGECANFTTNDCIKVILDGKRNNWTGSFRKFEHSLVNHDTDLKESREIWNSIAFYNYLQKPMIAPRTKISYEEFKKSEDAFFEVIDELKPQLIIVWGVTDMFYNMPSGERWQAGDELIVDGYKVKNGYYRLANGKNARVLWVYDPSIGYSYEKWYKVIKTEL